MDRGLSPDAVPSADATRTRDPDAAEPGQTGSRRSRTDRHARSDDGGQISVQDLLRRSRSDS